jgi:hypothetical protein
MIRYANDGTVQPPALRAYLNFHTLDELPEWSAGPGSDLDEQLAEIRAAGYDGVELIDGGKGEHCRQHGLSMCRAIRVNEVVEADRLVGELVDLGHRSGTVHVGWGMEDDDVALRLLEAVMTASNKFQIPLFPEIHRATVFQDMWRTVRLIEHFPEMRLNIDVVHWYTGLEMVYGGFEEKLAFIRPVFKRAGFVHGRIGHPGNIQVAVTGPDDDAIYVQHFRTMWTECFAAFLSEAEPGDYIVFAPELLHAGVFYARTVVTASGEITEESDRWQQALWLVEIAKQCFSEARQQVSREQTCPS